MVNRKRQIQICVLIVVAILILIVAIIGVKIIQSEEFVITNQEGTKELDNLIACCVEIKNIDYFENLTFMRNSGRTDTVGYYGKELICVSEEGNILGLECMEFSKEDLNEEWLANNAKCVNYCDNQDYNKFSCKNNPCFLWEFGNNKIRRIK